MVYVLTKSQHRQAALAKRPAPKSEADAALVFVTKYGEIGAKDVADSPISKEMRRLLNKLGIAGHRNYYTLRHTFRTVADESKDQPAVDFIMSHEIPHMSAVYRETISDDRLRAVTDHVRTGSLRPPSPSGRHRRASHLKRPPPARRTTSGRIRAASGCCSLP